MARFVAKDTIYPTIGEVIDFVAVRSGLVSTGGDDEVYEVLKLFRHEQKGKDFLELSKVLDDLQFRFQETYALFGEDDLTFEAFRRFLDRYKSLVLVGRANGWSRKQFIEEELIPKFVVPYVAWWLKELNRSPFDFLDLDKLLRSKALLIHQAN